MPDLNYSCSDKTLGKITGQILYGIALEDAGIEANFRANQDRGLGGYGESPNARVSTVYSHLETCRRCVDFYRGVLPEARAVVEQALEKQS